MSKDKKYADEETLITHAGYDPHDYFGVVNPPVVRTSSILYPSLSAYEDPQHNYRYGRYGTPFTDSFIGALCALENAGGGIVAPSGLAAITTAFLSFVSSGDHVLVADCIYPPTRQFCNATLTRMGVDVEYYNPHIGAGIKALFRPNTKLLYMESPGSATFDVQDVPALTSAAKDEGVLTMLDNSWASGYLFKPLDHGVDLSIVSCTKYIGGHSDIMLGAVLAKEESILKTLVSGSRELGTFAGSEEIYLALRGIKTLPIRMKEAGARGLNVAQFLEGQKGVQKVYHPALPSHPQHKIWARDYKGCNGLVSILLEPASKDAVKIFIESLTLFPIGSSWGGYESLLQPQYMKTCRSAVPWKEDGFLVRLQIGLEGVEDLKADLKQALDRFNQARG